MSKIEFTETKMLRNVDRRTRVIKLVKIHGSDPLSWQSINLEPPEIRKLNE